MAFVLGNSAVRPLTAEEVMRMVETGILGEDERVELLHGLLWEKPVKSPEHEWIKGQLVDWLMARRTYVVRVDGPLAVPDRISLPEPDIAVVAPGVYRHKHPNRALLVIEVAAASLDTDMRVKPALYAAARVPEYWVVDVNGKCIHVFTEPGPSGYAQRTTHSGADQLTPTAIEAPPLAVAALFAATR